MIVAAPRLARKGGESIVREYLIAFLISVAASVVACYICKWLDRNDDGNGPEG